MSNKKYVFSKVKYINDLIRCGYPETIELLLKSFTHKDKLQEWLQAEYDIKPALDLDGELAEFMGNGITLRCKDHVVSIDWCREVE